MSNYSLIFRINDGSNSLSYNGHLVFGRHTGKGQYEVDRGGVA